VKETTSIAELITSTAAHERPMVGPAKVLVMDDEPVIRDVAGHILKYLGYEAAFARDGAEAIEVYQRARDTGMPVDVVIMDLTVPGGMGGKEAIKRLREIDPDVKAIVSSGYSEDPIMSEFGCYGFSACVAKPYRIQDLGQALQKVIGHG
jgi:two-component system, cell cycle sensor histidine kinase and response regulator CckA